MNVTLHDYQQAAVDFAVQHPKCGLFLDLGLGKTLISLAVLEKVYMQETGHILIIAPKAIAKATWIGEIKKWGLNIPYKSLIVNEKGKELSRKKRLEAYKEAVNNPVRTIYFINRDILCDLIDNCPTVNNQKIWVYQTVIIDELQGFKSPDSKRFKAMKFVTPAVNRFIGLTATPTPKDISDIWSQIYLMDSGMRLGKNITAFRKSFMHPGYTNPQGVVCQWLPNNGAESVIYSLISDIVISMKNTNLKLPPIVFIDDIVYMSEDETKLYKKFVKDSVLEFEPGVTATAVNAAVMSAKLQQLASGAIYTIDDNGVPTGNYSVIHKQKLERLEYIRNNSDDNILIAYQFKSDADMIKKHFDALGLPCEIFDSDKSDEYIRRWDAGEIPTLLIQPAAAGFGLNFQYSGHTLVWYTQTFNLEHFLQTTGRLYRQGQTKTVYVHLIITDGTIDSHIVKVRKDKNQQMQQLLDAIELSPTQQESLSAFNEALSLASTVSITNQDMLDVINAIASEMD